MLNIEIVVELRTDFRIKLLGLHFFFRDWVRFRYIFKVM